MGDVFVHVRAKEYAKTHIVKAFSYFHSPMELVYEGIEMRSFDRIEDIVSSAKAFSPDKILIHFYQSWMLDVIIKRMGVPVIVWVHGYEALGWYRRLFNYTLYSPVLLNYIKKNTRQQFHFRNLIRYSNRTGKVKLVFVSDWMRRITEADTFTHVNNKHIIPNPIDTELFEYREKDPELRKKVLLLRSFSSRKYANDISVQAIMLLSSTSIFKDLHFTIIGMGPLFQKTVAPLKNFSNVSLEEKAVRQVSIPDLHAEHGIFLCPTRQDAQGVSMCEAMSSGLVPVTSDNTAIPEFVINSETGCLNNSPKEVAKSIETLYYEPDLFQKLSSCAATSIRALCSMDAVVTKELQIIQN